MLTDALGCFAQLEKPGNTDQTLSDDYRRRD
jgi:hypothetical protein